MGFCGLILLGILTTVWLVLKPSSSVPARGSAAAPNPAATVTETTQQEAVVEVVRPPTGGRPPLEWGIEVVGLYPAVGGRVLDLRYKILETAKAALLPNQPGQIYLIDEATGAAISLPNSPRTGSIPQNPQKLEAGRTYSMGFPNPGGRFKSGSKVTVVIGNFRAEHLTVL